MGEEEDRIFGWDVGLMPKATFLSEFLFGKNFKFNINVAKKNARNCHRSFPQIHQCCHFTSFIFHSLSLYGFVFLTG